MAQRTSSRNPPLPEFHPEERASTGLKPSTLFGLAWMLVSIGVLAYGFRQALFIAPTEATMGNVQRIFYWHVPNAIMGLIFPYVNFAASLAYLFLRRRNPFAALAADALALAAAEVTLVFVTIGLITGMLWGRPVWGIWWTWDARLTTYLLLWLLYVAYLMVRRLSASGQTSTLGAVLSIFAAIDVPIVYFSIQWWRTQHPSPVLTGDGELDPAMKHAFNINFLGWFLWGCFIVGLRYALERRRQIAEQEATLRSLEATLTDLDPISGHTGPEANNAL
jgi:heme exporter protein C